MKKQTVTYSCGCVESHTVTLAEKDTRYCDRPCAKCHRENWERAKAQRVFEVEVLVVPPNYEIALGLNTVHYEKRRIVGLTLEDAKSRAGIQ